MDEEPVHLPITDIIDLHSFSPRDITNVVEAWLEEAHKLNIRFVRIIHGRGIGAQRAMVRSILERTSFVEEFQDAPPEAGGWGATTAVLAPLPEKPNNSRSIENSNRSD